jgi:hypothetical protein
VSAPVLVELMDPDVSQSVPEEAMVALDAGSW